MHIGFVDFGTLYPFHLGGPGVVAYNLLKQFDRHGLAVDFLLVWDGPKLKASDLGLSSKVRVRTVPFSGLKLFTPLSRYLSLKSSLVHFNGTSLRPHHVLLPLIDRLMRTRKLVHSVHGYPSFEFILNQSMKRPLSWIANADFRLVLKMFDKTVVFSEYMRRLVSLHVPAEQIELIPLGVDLGRFERYAQTARQGPDLTLIFVGRLVHVKGVETLVRALGLLKDEYRIQTYMMGDGPLRHGLEALARRLGLSERIRFCGFVSEETLVKRLQLSDIFVLPSMYEPIPLVILEAFSARVPVIASSVGGIPELVRNGHNGILVSPGDPQQLANAISRLANDPDMRRTLASNARRFAESCDWSSVAKTYVQLYEKILA